MRNSGKQNDDKRKRSWKHKVKPCDDLDGASRRDNAKNLELRKKNRWNTGTENYFIMNNLRKKRIESPRGNKNKIYCMFILHQIKLMTSNGFGILLILVENIKIWRKLKKVFDEPPVELGNNEWIDMITKEVKSWTNHRKNWKRD